MNDKKFNLKDYKKINGNEHIDMRLEQQRSEAPNVINEKQLEVGRVNEKNVTIEKLLEKNRVGEETEVTEKRLDTHKPKFSNKYRNPEAYTGDLNKLEEQRLNSKTAEKEKYEPASETPKQLRWWEEKKGPDSLKLAQKKIEKIAQYDSGDADVSDVFESLTETDPDKYRPDLDNFEIKEETPEVEEEEATPPQGTMKIVKEKDIFQPQRPDLSGIYFQLSYDPREFGGDQKAITDEIISVISEKRPELGEELRGAQQDKEVESLHNPTVDPAIFSFLDIDGNLGLIKAGLVGPEWKNFINQDQPIVNPSAKNKSVAPKATSDKFIEVSYETPNVNGTPMAVGSVRTLEDINEENKDRISNEIITFIKKNHPEIKVDKNSLDFSKIDENKIQYMVGIMGGNVAPELSADEEFDITEKRMEEQERLEQEELAARTPEEIAQDEEDEREYQKLMAELNAPDEPISQDETPLDENGKPINTASSKKN